MFRQIVDTLVPKVEEREARALAFVVLEDSFGLSRTDIYLGKDTAFSEEDTIRLEKILRRLEQGEPVQYAIGTAQFCDLTFRVTPDTLIPRPETEELVGWVASLLPSDASCSVLDVGTGTGCIAISLAKQFPRAQVTAWDISEGALAVAQQNNPRGAHCALSTPCAAARSAAAARASSMSTSIGTAGQSPHRRSRA